jgi:hypothetical protein
MLSVNKYLNMLQVLFSLIHLADRRSYFEFQIVKVCYFHGKKVFNVASASLFDVSRLLFPVRK